MSGGDRCQEGVLSGGVAVRRVAARKDCFCQEGLLSVGVAVRRDFFVSRSGCQEGLLLSGGVGECTAVVFLHQPPAAKIYISTNMLFFITENINNNRKKLKFKMTLNCGKACNHTLCAFIWL